MSLISGPFAMLEITWAGAAREVYASILASTSLKASHPSALAPPAGTMMWQRPFGLRSHSLSTMTLDLTRYAWYAMPDLTSEIISPATRSQLSQEALAEACWLTQHNARTLRHSLISASSVPMD